MNNSYPPTPGFDNGYDNGNANASRPSHPLPQRPLQVEAPMIEEEAECQVIGFLLGLNDMDLAEHWMARLDIDCFRTARCRLVYTLMLEVLEQEQLPSMPNVWQQQRLQHPDRSLSPTDLVGLMDAARMLADITPMVEVLHDFKVRRSLQDLALLLSTAARDTLQPVATTIEKALSILDQQDVAVHHHFTSIEEVCPRLTQIIHDNQDEQTRHHGPYTGISAIDDAGGLPETGLTIIAAGTSQGKSAMAAAIALASADHGRPTGYFSLEMTAEGLACRMAAMRGVGPSANSMLHHTLSDSDYSQALLDVGQLSERYGQMVYFDDSRSSNLDDICTGIRRMVHDLGVRQVIVDYLQLLSFTMAGRMQNVTIEQLMGRSARTLKNLGDRLGISVIALSQTNRSMERQRPSLSIVRDSGQIGEAADMVLMCWHPFNYHGLYDGLFAKYDPALTIALLIVKNRQGPLMEVMARWTGDRTLISELLPGEGLLEEADDELRTVEAVRQLELFKE